MLIMLPPSEGKVAAGSGAPLDLAALSLPALRGARDRVLRSLVRLCAGRETEHARTALGLSPGQRGDVDRNARLRTAAAAPAGQVYTGVLYEALDLASLPTGSRAWVEGSVLVFSGLWGALRLDDRIPPYRCSMAARLPTVGALAAYWRAALPAALDTTVSDHVVLDLRSSAYAAAWAPGRAAAPRTLGVRVLHERMVDGVPKRSVVSHFNKAVKGSLVRTLALAGAEPRSPGELIGTLRDLGHVVVERAPAADGSRRLDVVVSALSVAR